MLMKLSNFEKAVARLQEGVDRYDGLDELARGGLILQGPYYAKPMVRV